MRRIETELLYVIGNVRPFTRSVSKRMATPHEAVHADDPPELTGPPRFDASDRVIKDGAMLRVDAQRLSGGEEHSRRRLPAQVVAVGDDAVDA